MVVDELVEQRFWIEWEDKFESDSNSYITPQHPEVEEAASVASPPMGASDAEIGRAAWDYVYDKVNYKLSKEWKTPAQTLRERTGDCEDVTFLIASMLPNMGVDESKIVIGDLKFPDGREELHTWNEVGGIVIDATGSMSSAEMAEYVPKTTYAIVSE